MKINISKIFTSLIVFYAIFYVYRSPIATLTVADVLLIVLFPIFIWCVLKNKSKKIVSIPIMLVFLYFCVQLIIIIIACSPNYTNTILWPTLRYLTYLFTIAFLMRSLFNVEFGIILYKITSLFASIYLLIQIFCIKFFNFYLQGTIPGLPLDVEHLEIFNQVMSIDSNALRARSIFCEISHYATYVILFLAIELFYSKRKNWKVILIITLALLLSGSSAGIILTGLLYVTYGFIQLKKLSKTKIVILQIILILIAILALFYTRTKSFELFYNRVFINQDSVKGRFGNYDLIFLDRNISTINLLFGRGMLKITDYIPSIPRIYFYSGLVGMIFYSVLSIICFYKLNGLKRFAFILLFITAFFGEILFHSLLFIYIPFIVNNEENKRILYDGSLRKLR